MVYQFKSNVTTDQLIVISEQYRGNNNESMYSIYARCSKYGFFTSKLFPNENN